MADVSRSRHCFRAETANICALAGLHGKDPSADELVPLRPAAAGVLGVKVDAAGQTHLVVFLEERLSESVR